MKLLRTDTEYSGCHTCFISDGSPIL